MYLLDTNVISELRRSKPHGNVLTWLQGISAADLRIAAVTIGEIQAGIELTRERDPAKARSLEAWLDQIIDGYEIIAMDARAFRLLAKLMYKRSDDLYEDAMIATLARIHGLTVVTRNIRDFAPFGVTALDPFATPG